jgi:hypothetical protein
MTTEKFTLTTEEVKKYNELKLKIRRARTRLEVSLYTKQAQDILDNGRHRYVKRLEQKKSAEIKGELPSVNLIKGKLMRARKIAENDLMESKGLQVTYSPKLQDLPIYGVMKIPNKGGHYSLTKKKKDSNPSR